MKPPEPTKPRKLVDPDHDPDHPELWDQQYWLDKALEAAFKGVDMKQLEKDWLDN